MKVAEQGLGELQEHVHSLIVILNNKTRRGAGGGRRDGRLLPAADDVLHNACAGIAEIINIPGLVNVDFEDVKTVMSEHGKAMMGTSTASGATGRAWPPSRPWPVRCWRAWTVGRARRSGQYHRKPSLKMRENARGDEHDREFAAEDATVIFGTVCDDSIGDGLRVTVVATGLGKAGAKKAPLTVRRSRERHTAGVSR